MKRKTEKPAATITIYRPGRMLPEERRDVAKWLRWHADHLIKSGKDYTCGRFTGRFGYNP